MPPIQLTDTSPEDDLEKDGFVLLGLYRRYCTLSCCLRVCHTSQRTRARCPEDYILRLPRPPFPQLAVLAAQHLRLQHASQMVSWLTSPVSIIVLSGV